MTETILGAGEYRYEVDSLWAKLPDGWHFGDVSAIAIDQDDNVYVFGRSEHPLTVFDRDGLFLWSMGEGLFKRPHGVFLAPDGTIFLTDDGDHTVRQFDRDGRVLMTLGIPNRSAPWMSGEPFNRCTNVAMSPEGDLYISDGYGNARVHRYSPEGRLLFSWGSPGIGPGEFNVVHHIACDRDGIVYVADRENHRIQLFDGGGRYLDQWNYLHRPCGLHLREDGGEKRFYVGESAPELKVSKNIPNLGPRVSILDGEGTVLARIGECRLDFEPGGFASTHSVAADSHGDIYVGEVSHHAWRKHHAGPPPANLKSLQKLRRISTVA